MEPAIAAADAEHARVLAPEFAPERQIDQIGLRAVLEPGERALRAPRKPLTCANVLCPRRESNARHPL